MVTGAPIPISPDVLARLRAFEALLRDVNQRFNLISRGEETAIWEHHILHCLLFAIRDMPRGARIVDWGTGGGLPAIPLSIVWPDVRMVAVDSNAKKTRAVTLFARRLGLENCVAVHSRAENVCAGDLGGGPLWSVSRATAPLATLWSWHERARELVEDREAPATRGPVVGGEAHSAQGALVDGSGLNTPFWAPGLVCLKGGDLREELAEHASRYPTCKVLIVEARDYIDAPWFATKKLLHITGADGK